MTWVKIDDASPHHPKARRAGLEAWGLYVASLAYASRHLTDGRIESTALEDVWPWSVPPARLAAMAARLVECGLWETVPDGGWTIHDYLAYQPSAEDVRAKRHADAERKKRGGRPPSVRTPDGFHAESDRIPSGLRAESETTRARDPVPSRPVPSDQKKIMSDAEAPDLVLAPPGPAPSEPIVDRVFVHWQTKCDRLKSKRTKQRIGKIRARLADGYTEADLMAAIDGVAASDFHRGANDRGMRYDDLELILRDGSHVEKYGATRTPVAETSQAEHDRRAEALALTAERTRPVW